VLPAPAPKKAGAVFLGVPGPLGFHPRDPGNGRRFIGRTFARVHSQGPGPGSTGPTIHSRTKAFLDFGAAAGYRAKVGKIRRSYGDILAAADKTAPAPGISPVA